LTGIPTNSWLAALVITIVPPLRMVVNASPRCSLVSTPTLTMTASAPWTAGHTVSGIRRVSTVAEIVAETAAEYRAARDVPAPDSLTAAAAAR
jgi:hypothetical protein